LHAPDVVDDLLWNIKYFTTEFNFRLIGKAHAMREGCLTRMSHVANFLPTNLPWLSFMERSSVMQPWLAFEGTEERINAENADFAHLGVVVKDDLLRH
jgi:hypothetical protein